MARHPALIAKDCWQYCDCKTFDNMGHAILQMVRSEIGLE